MRLVSRPLALVGALFLATTSQAWIDTGHMLIAAIAEHNLNPKVKAECDRLLAIGGDERNSDFVSSGPWADDYRSSHRETGPWHYIDYHFGPDGKATANKPDAENVVWAIKKFSAILKDKSKSDAERSDALRFLIHFVGDIHQPLHACARDTPAHPDGDKGGNDFRIIAPDVFNGMGRPPRNLHSLWDFGCGLFKGESRPLSSAARTRIEAQAKDLIARVPARELNGRAIRDLDPTHWAEESYYYDTTFVYNLPDGSKPSDDYIKRGQQISTNRIVYAGYRLANLLNSLLK